jgi:hypothetical protein
MMSSKGRKDPKVLDKVEIKARKRIDTKASGLFGAYHTNHFGSVETAKALGESCRAWRTSSILVRNAGRKTIDILRRFCLGHDLGYPNPIHPFLLSSIIK